MRKPLWMIWGMAAILIIGGELRLAQGQTGTRAITTNKDKCLTIAVQGQIAPSEPGRSYTTTWDGKPKMARLGRRRPRHHGGRHRGRG